MKIVIGCGFALLMVLQVRLWAGEGSLASMWELQRSIDARQAQNALLEARNERLIAEVKDLRSGVQTVEARARRELGMIGPGETFFLVIDEARPGS
jgi:cell division protein FtsB